MGFSCSKQDKNGATADQVHSEEALNAMTVKELKEITASRGIPADRCIEKADLVAVILRSTTNAAPAPEDELHDRVSGDFSDVVSARDLTRDKPKERAPSKSQGPTQKEISAVGLAIRKLQRPIEEQARMLQDSEDGRVWAEASYLLDLMQDAAKMQPACLEASFGSLSILTRHLNRFHDEVKDVINNGRSTANLERVLRGDLKMIQSVTVLEKALGVDVVENAPTVA